MEIRSTTTDILVILTVSSGSLWRLSTMHTDRYGPKLECIASTLDTLMHKITLVPNPEFAQRLQFTGNPAFIMVKHSFLIYIYINGFHQRKTVKPAQLSQL